MTPLTHSLWTEKYRPSTLDDYVFQNPRLKQSIEGFIHDKSIPHLLLSGTPGSGKTTLALILISELGVDPNDVLSINASDENSVDLMRDKIKGFVSTFALGTFKVVHLEEADYITPAGQAILRRLMETYSDSARFILTCNYDNKLIAPIRSRMQQFHFVSPDINDVAERIATILIKENITFDVGLLDKYVSTGYPDIRKIINIVQQNSIEGELLTYEGEIESGDYKFRLLELIEEGSWSEARKLVCSSITNDEWESLYRFMYTNLSKVFSDHDKWEQGIVTIADHLYKHTLSSDPEINGAAMFIKLSKI